MKHYQWSLRIGRILSGLLLFTLPAFAQTKLQKPRFLDLRGDMSAVKNQGDRNICASFATIALVEYALKKKYKKEFNLSESFMHYSTKALFKDKKEETSFFDCMDAFRKTGFLFEGQWPATNSFFLKGYPCEEYRYDDKKTPFFCYTYYAPPDSLLQKAMFFSFRFRSHQMKRIEDLTDAMFRYMAPVAFAFPLSDSNWRNSGIITIDSPPVKDQNHIAVICGYDMDKQVFFVKNSWGTHWGDKGYGTISFDMIKNYALDNGALLYPVEDSLDELIPIDASFHNTHLQNFNTKVSLHNDQSVSIKMSGQIDSLGFRSILLETTFYIEQKKGDSTHRTKIYFTGEESKQLKSLDAQVSSTYQSANIFQSKLNLDTLGSSQHIFSEEMILSPSFQDAIQNIEAKVILETTISYSDDIHLYVPLAKATIEVDKAKLIRSKKNTGFAKVPSENVSFR